jgi:hypothetical protein
MAPYVIRQGDYLVKLAFIHGFDVDDVWSDPKNDEIRALRGDHHILAPGDVVHIPIEAKEGLPITKGTTNRYVATVPKVPVNVRFRDADGPMADTKFVIEGAPATPAEGTTDGDGRVSLLVPAYVVELTVRFPDRGSAHRVLVGHLDPASERLGVAARLAQLGYLSAWKLETAPLAPALAAFQEEHGLEPTGVVDDATRDALKRAHGA